MNPVGIDGARVAPLSVDLTLPNYNLKVLRGMEKAFRVDKPAAAALALVAGEWGVLQADGTVARPGASSVAATYLCFLGTDRFDAAATGNVTLFMDTPLLVKTSRFVAGSYSVGEQLTVNDNNSTTATPLAAGSGDWVVAHVVEVGTDGTITYQTVPTPYQKA